MYKRQQINKTKDEKRQNFLADDENNGYIPFFFLKSIKLSSKPRQWDKKLDLPSKYEIKKILD